MTPHHGFQRADCKALGDGRVEGSVRLGDIQSSGDKSPGSKRLGSPSWWTETTMELLLVVSQGKLGNQVKLQLSSLMVLKAVCWGAWARSPQGSIFFPIFPYILHSCQLNDCTVFCSAGIPWIIKPLPWCWKFRLFPIFFFLLFRIHCRDYFQYVIFLLQFQYLLRLNL